MNFFSSPRAQSLIFAILSSAFSSIATIFKVQGVKTVPPLLAAAVGILFASIITWGFLFSRHKLPQWEKIVSVKKPLIMLIFCRSIVSNILFTIGLSFSSGIVAVFLTKMEPYFVIFWIWILDGKRPQGSHLWLLLLHVFGAFLLSAGGHSFSLQHQSGDLMIVVAVLTAALSYRYIPQVTKALTATQTAAVSELSGGLLTLPFALMLCPLEWQPAQQMGWCYIGVHAVLFYVFAVSLLYASLHGIEAWLSSALRATGPLIAVPIAWLAFGDSLNFIQCIGAALVLTTSALISRAGKKSPR